MNKLNALDVITLTARVSQKKKKNDEHTTLGKIEKPAHRHARFNRW